MKNLEFFTQPEILRQIGSRRLTKFFDGFREDLKTTSILLPSAESENGSYFDSLARILESSAMPDRLRAALSTLETAALSESRPRLDSAIQRRIPTVSLSGCCALDCALELWFHAPDEFSEFQTGPCNNATVQPRNVSPSPCHPTIDESNNPSIQPVPGPTIQESSNPIIPPREADADAFSRLAQFSITDYDRVRRAEAKRLHLRLATLDTEVARCRSQINDDAQANAVKFPVIEPWHSPVLDAPELLDQVSARYTNYIILPPGAADAIALFTGHAHAFTAFYQTPRLNLYSPRRGCGKTTTLDVLATMVPRPFRTENMRAPVLFRVVDQQQPILLLDEVDTYLHQADELRGLLNAGHKRGACAYRCEGAGNAIRAFKAFAPAVLAGIGELPPTLHDRSILIPLIPAEPGQVRARFDEHHTDLEKTLASKLARWAKDNYNALAASDPLLPPSAFNRLADNWRPLFAVAQVVGGQWPQRAADAFAKLTCASLPSPPFNPFNNLTSSTRVPANHQLSTLDSQLLLADIRQVFAKAGVTRMFSQELVTALSLVPSRPWSDASIQQSTNPSTRLTAARLARHLAMLGIYPRLFRIAHGRGKGYELADFTQAFHQFLPPPDSNGHT